MIRNKLFAALFLGSFLTACSSGDINISPSTIDNSVDNSVSSGGGGVDSSICAAYIESGAEVRGQADADGNCNYGLAFSGPTNNVTGDLVIPALPNGAAHIFTSSLFIGNTYRTQADLAAAGITQGGDGPTLTIEAGATLAFANKKDFIIINRGSRIVANGTADAPITITSTTDVDGTVGPEDVQQWGGIVINGFAVSNKCSYVGIRGQAGFALEPGTECSIEAEGSAGDDESQYGGDNDDDDSGVLRYVIVKHTGAEVASGSELNGISFGGVGRGTTIENLQVYSVYDDGIELFGGSVDINNYVAIYVRDDSIDIDEGYNGTITNALVIQQATDGNHCIESDGLGSYSSLDQATKDDFIARGLNSAPTFNSLTCLVTPNDTGTHDPGAGILFREGIHPILNNSLVVTTYTANDPALLADNYCLWIRQAETQAAAVAGDLQLNGVIFSCQSPERGEANDGIAGGEQAFVESGNGQYAADAIAASGSAFDPTAAADTSLQLLEGPQGIYSIELATSSVDGLAPTVTAVEVDGATPTFLGGVSAADDWTKPWAYGIDPANRAEPLPWE